jgi:hypothetical protein
MFPFVLASLHRRRTSSLPSLPPSRHVGVTDPADLVAKARAELGFSRQHQQPRRIPPPPVLVAVAAILCGIGSSTSGDFMWGKEYKSLLHPSTDEICVQSRESFC